MENSVIAMEKINSVIDEIADSRKALIKAFRTYYINVRDKQMSEKTLYRSKRRNRMRYVCISNEYLKRIQNLSSIFSQFKILGPGVVEYGSRTRGNFRICRVGEKDCFRNSICIHINLIQELIYGMWPTNPSISVEFEKYKKLISEFKRLSYEIK